MSFAEPPHPASEHDLTPLSAAEREALAAGLNEEERRVLLEQGTERPFCGGLLHEKRPGVYRCRLCGLPLFRSSTKFESGTGWPSFTAPYHPAHIRYLRDLSHGMLRTEIRCARCDGHLGHVFEDGPPPTGLRYCLNSVALRFEVDQPEQTGLPTSGRQPDRPAGGRCHDTPNSNSSPPPIGSRSGRGQP